MNYTISLFGNIKSLSSQAAKMGVLLLVLQFIYSSSYSQGREIYFEVFLKNDKIGEVLAVETINGTKMIRNVKLESTAHVLAVSVHLETDTKVINEDKVLVEGVAYRHANHGAKEIHATTKRLNAKKYQRERNGVSSFLEQDIKFCVADLFFEEPVDLKDIYSNMFAEMLLIKDLGNGKYEIISPEKKTTLYTYIDGKLMIIESHTPAGIVQSKRK